MRQSDAVADGDGVSALGDDAGEARDDEELECVADLLDVYADDSGDAADAVGDCEFGACVCAESNIGDWFYGFILIVFAVCLFTFFRQRDHLKSENRLESLVSRESSFLFNNLILLAACFTVLWGTLFPVLSEYVQGTKVTMGAPFYNRVNLPIGLFLLFLTGIGPLLAWRSTSLRSIRRNFILPGIAMGVALVVLLAVGVRPWEAGDDWQATLFSLVTFTLAAGVITAIAAEFLRGASVVCDADGEESAGFDGAAGAEEYAAVWRVYRSLRHCGDVYRDCGRGVQPVA